MKIGDVWCGWAELCPTKVSVILFICLFQKSVIVSGSTLNYSVRIGKSNNILDEIAVQDSSSSSSQWNEIEC